MRRWVSLIAAVGLVGAVAELVLIGLAIWWVGAAWTLGALVVKGVLGYLLVRRVGRRGWQRLRAVWDANRPPGRDAAEAAVALVAALMVMLGGAIGTVLGLVALLTPVRQGLAGRVESGIERRVSRAVAGDVFGPRRVKVQRGASSPEPAPAAETPGGSAPGEPIEGEILPPR